MGQPVWHSEARVIPSDIRIRYMESFRTGGESQIILLPSSDSPFQIPWVTLGVIGVGFVLPAREGNLIFLIGRCWVSPDSFKR